MQGLFRALSEPPGQSFFDTLVESLVDALSAEHVFVGELMDDGERMRLHAFAGPDGLERRDARDVVDTPTFPLLDENERPVGVLGILTPSPAAEDPLIRSFVELLAPRAAAEILLRRGGEERRRAERHLRALRQAGNRFVWGVDADGRGVLGTMANWIEMTGQDLRVDRGPEHWLDVVHPEDRDRVRREWRTAMAREEDFDTEYRVLGPQGVRHLHVRGIAVHDDDGTFEGLLGTIDDVSEHRRTAEDLRRRNEVLRVLRAVPEATHNGAGFLESLRAALTELCRFSGFPLGRVRMQDSDDGPLRYSGIWSAHPDGSVDRPMAEALPSPLDHDDDLARTVESSPVPLWLTDVALGDDLDGASERDVAGSVEPEAAGRLDWQGAGTVVLIPVRYDGTTVAVLELLAPKAVDPDETSQEAFSQVAMQLGRACEREKTQRQMRDAERRARESQKLEAVGRLAGGIAHDFNNLLMVLSGEADLALRVEDVPEAVRSALLEIRQSAQRASSLTGQLLAFSRREMDRPERVDLCELVRSAERMLGRIIGENIDLTLGAMDGVERCQVSIPPGLLEQVLVNLVVNAREAMPDGGSLHIAIANELLDPSDASALPGAEPGAYVVVSVADTGSGIAEEIHASIFDPFFTTKPGGTGFGLSTSYGIVASAGGFIDFHTEQGVGTEFQVWLPVDSSDEDADTPGEHPTVEPSANRTLLVVEDDDGVRSVAVRILEAAGYEVTAARGRHEVESYLDAVEEGPEVLVTDCVLEKATGREVEELVSGRFPEVATVFMSGYTDDVLLSQGVRTDGSTFLAKPFSPEALVESVERVLADRRELVSPASSTDDSTSN